MKNKSVKICLKCDNGKGHKMIEIWSYKVSGDPDKLLCYLCPNCHHEIKVKESNEHFRG